MGRLALLVALTILTAVPSLARDPAQVRTFRGEHPCPSTGRRRGPCPGYVVDHIDPLCHGGPDTPANMQWQTTRDAKVKDRWERQLCHATTYPNK